MSRFVRLVVVGVLTAALAVPVFAQKEKDNYFVGFKASVTAKDKAMLKGHGAALRDEIPESRAVQIAISNPHALAAIQNNPNVEYVEDVGWHTKMDLAGAQATPSLQNGLYGIVTTGTNAVWTRGVTGTGVKVGVADTQLDISHPDIAGNLFAHTDCVQRNPCSGSGWANDGETHATHVAGTILGVNNNAGVLGVAYTSQLAHARVLGPSGGSSSRTRASSAPAAARARTSCAAFAGWSRRPAARSSTSPSAAA